MSDENPAVPNVGAPNVSPAAQDSIETVSVPVTHSLPLALPDRLSSLLRKKAVRERTATHFPSTSARSTTAHWTCCWILSASRTSTSTTFRSPRLPRSSSRLRGRHSKQTDVDAAGEFIYTGVAADSHQEPHAACPGRRPTRSMAGTQDDPRLRAGAAPARA